MNALITAALAAVTEGLKLANTAASRKYIDRITEIRLEILREEEKGYESDDAKLESLYKELVVVVDGAKNEIALLQARNPA